MPLADYAHHNEDALRVWWEEEGKHPDEPSEPDPYDEARDYDRYDFDPHDRERPEDPLGAAIFDGDAAAVNEIVREKLWDAFASLFPNGSLRTGADGSYVLEGTDDFGLGVAIQVEAVTSVDDFR